MLFLHCLHYLSHHSILLQLDRSVAKPVRLSYYPTLETRLPLYNTPGSMGVCASCLGLNRRESHDAESSRLLDDDIYQSGYGYGALNHSNQINNPDPENIKREREALEAICQRTSESVIDIWSLQPQPHLQPRATLHGSVASKASSSSDVPVKIITADPSKSPISSKSGASHDGASCKHWGEVVINPRKGKKARPGLNTDETNGRDVFGVLKVT